MKMISERGINIHLFPMIQRRGRVFEGEYVRKNSKGEVVFIAKEGSRWNLRCYKFMDWIATRLRSKFDQMAYKNYPELGPVTKTTDVRLSEFILLSTPSLIYDVIKYINNPIEGLVDSVKAQIYKASPTIKINDIAKELKWRNREVIEIIEMISNCKMKMSYQIKHAEIYNKVTYNYNYWYDNFKGDFDPILNVNLNEEKSMCQFLFNTGFSICFLHNIFCNGYELVNDQLYSLSESSQIIYRKRFFTYSKIPNARITLDYISNQLGLTNKNNIEKKKLLKKITYELVSKNLVNLIEEHDDWVELSLGKQERKIINLDERKVGPYL